ncbi:MAG: DNA polymerase III subunit delta [Clostridiales bacterium]|nr:DNA polymerase III subunit delta [Clostridiales bacterium]
MEKDHAYKRIQADIKSGSIKNPLLLYGKEQYLVKWSVDAIVKKFVNGGYRAFDFVQVDAENSTLAEIIENCETLSVFSEKRVVCVFGFKPVAGGKLKGFPEPDLNRLAEYVKTIPDSCILIITSDKVDKRLKLYREIASFGGAYDFEQLDVKTLGGFIEKHFKGLGKKIKKETVSELVSYSGYYHKESDYSLFNLDNDIKKIAAISDGEEILPADVVEAVSADVETGVFELIDAIGRNQKGRALRILHNILGMGGKFYFILAILVSQFEIILGIKELWDEGKPTSQISGILGVNEYRVKKAAEVARLYSTGQLREVLKKAYQVESNAKADIIEGALALEVLISEV